MGPSNRLTGTVGDIIRARLDETDDLLVVNPPREGMHQLITDLHDSGSSRVRLFADADPLKDLMDDFLIASRAADLVDAGTLSIRTFDEVPKNALLVSPSAVTALVEGPDAAAGLSTGDEEFVTATYGAYDDRWEAASEFSLRTPPLSRVRETLRSEISETVAEDFDTVLEAVETARGNGDGLDEVTISLLVAARNGELLYDISKWGEDVGLASKATFSRTKKRLEENGLIDTEKVPIDVGRPRLRLRLANGLADDSIDDLTAEVQAVL